MDDPISYPFASHLHHSAQPSVVAASMGKANVYYDPNGYNLTENPVALPMEFTQTAICHRFYVEILKTTTGDETVYETKTAANHAVFKIDLESRYGLYSGLRLEMAVDHTYTSTIGSIDGQLVMFKSGYLCAKPTREPRASSSSLCTCELSVRSGYTVGHVIDIIFAVQMQHFDFINIDDKYYGCRDFMYVVYTWDDASR